MPLQNSSFSIQERHLITLLLAVIPQLAQGKLFNEKSFMAGTSMTHISSMTWTSMTHICSKTGTSITHINSMTIYQFHDTYQFYDRDLHDTYQFYDRDLYDTLSFDFRHKYQFCDKNLVMQQRPPEHISPSAYISVLLRDLHDTQGLRQGPTVHITITTAISRTDISEQYQGTSTAGTSRSEFSEECYFYGMDLKDKYLRTILLLEQEPQGYISQDNITSTTGTSRTRTSFTTGISRTLVLLQGPPGHQLYNRDLQDTLVLLQGPPAHQVYDKDLQDTLVLRQGLQGHKLVAGQGPAGHTSLMKGTSRTWSTQEGLRDTFFL